MENNRTLKDWIIATRPWSFPASITPIVVTTAYLYWQSRVCGFGMNWTNAVLSFLLLVILHASSNLIGDYYDYIKGVDKVNGPNGVTWIFSGKFTPGQVLHYGYALVAISALIGIVILLNSSAMGIWLGVAGILLVTCYFWMKSHAMGDIAVILGFAFLPSVGVSFVTTGEWHFETMLISITYGLITVAILHANNTRDIDNDAEAGLTTFCIAIGTKASQAMYLVQIIIPYLLIPVFCLYGLIPAWSMLTWLTIPVAVKNCRQMMVSVNGNLQIPTLDQTTAQLQMMFGIMLFASFIIASLS